MKVCEIFYSEDTEVVSFFYDKQFKDLNPMIRVDIIQQANKFFDQQYNAILEALKHAINNE